MENNERPQKRRKLDGDKEDGVLTLAPRSPRVVLSKINISGRTLDRLRRIKKLAREKLRTVDNPEENKTEELLQGDKEPGDTSIVLGGFRDDEKSTKKNHDAYTESTRLSGSTNSKDGSIEVLGSSGLSLSEDSTPEKNKQKRKRVENSNESIGCAKAAKLFDEKCVAEATESASLSVTEVTPKIKEAVCDQPLNTTPVHTDNPSETIVLKNDDVEKVSLAPASSIGNKEKIGCQTNDEDASSCAQAKVVEVAKNAGAQPGKTPDHTPCDSRDSAALSHSADGKNKPSSSDEPENFDPDDILVHQLLKDIIESRAKCFENDLVEKNAKLEKRVEHLEQENALLQRTSKRLHLALQQVLKHRITAQKSHLSRGVQVNTNIRLSRTVRQKASTINIDIQEEPSSSITQERMQPPKEATVSKGSPPSKSPQSPSKSNYTTKANDHSCNELRLTQKSPPKPTTTNIQTNKNLPEDSPSKQVNSISPKSGSSDTDTELKDLENEDRTVVVTTIGTQTESNKTPLNNRTEGMGHFRLDPIHRCRSRGNHNSSSSGGKTGHFRITPRGLEPQPNFSALRNLILTAPPQKRSQEFSQASKSTEKGFLKTFNENETITEVIDAGIARSNFEEIEEITQHSKRIADVSNVAAQNRVQSLVVDAGGSQPGTVPAISPSVTSNARTNVCENSSRKLEVTSNVGNRSTTSISTVLPSMNVLSPSVTNHSNSPPKFPDQRPLIPKHSTGPVISPQQQVTQTAASSKQPSLQSKETEPEITIVFPTERYSPKTSKPPERREHLLPRVAPNIAPSSETQTVQKQTEQSGRKYPTTSVISKRKEMFQYSDRNVPPKEVSSESVGSTGHGNQRLQIDQVGEKGLSLVTPSSAAQPHPTSRRAFQNPNRSIQVQKPPIESAVKSHNVPDSRYTSSNREVGTVDVTRLSENVPTDRVPGYPAQPVPSPVHRIQELNHPPRSAGYEVRGQMRSPHPNQQAFPQPVVSNSQLPRLPVTIYDVRTQHPSADPIPQQQHIVVRQHRPQQHSPTAFQQHRATFPPHYTQRHPINPQTNITRPQSQAHFQIRPPLQQATMVNHNVPTRPDPNSIKSQEMVHTSRPQHNPNVIRPLHPAPPGNMPQSRDSNPEVVYQPGALEGTRKFTRFPSRSDNVIQVQNQLQRPLLQVPLTGPSPQRSPQINGNVPLRGPNQAEPIISQRAPDRRPSTVPERPQGVQGAILSTTSPPKPSASIAVVENGIVLSWNISPEQNTTNIENYELFACQDDSNSSLPPVLWKKIGIVKALPLPMACTLTQFSTGSRYQFAVRAVDGSERAGPFSDPCVITLKKP